MPLPSFLAKTSELGKRWVSHMNIYRLFIYIKESLDTANTCARKQRVPTVSKHTVLSHALARADRLPAVPNCERNSRRHSTPAYLMGFLRASSIQKPPSAAPSIIPVHLYSPHRSRQHPLGEVECLVYVFSHDTTRQTIDCVVASRDGLVQRLELKDDLHRPEDLGGSGGC